MGLLVFRRLGQDWVYSVVLLVDQLVVWEEGFPLEVRGLYLHLLLLFPQFLVVDLLRHFEFPNKLFMQID